MNMDLCERVGREEATHCRLCLINLVNKLQPLQHTVEKTHNTGSLSFEAKPTKLSLFRTPQGYS